jgi:hypothetical protein
MDAPSSGEVHEVCHSFVDRFILLVRKLVKGVKINIYTSHTSKRHSYHIVLVNLYANDHLHCAEKAKKIVTIYADLFEKIEGV